MSHNWDQPHYWRAVLCDYHFVASQSLRQQIL
jgi:hypothetical protein